MKIKHAKPLLKVLLLFPLAFNVRADILFDSITPTNAISAGYDLANDTNFGPLYASFSTTTQQPEVLTDIKLALATSNPEGTGSTTISLYSDSAGTPGSQLAVLGVLSDSAIPAYTPATVDLPQSNPINLAASTRYWIQVSSSSDSDTGWSYTTDTTGTGVSSEFNANSFQVYANSGDPGVNLVSNPYQLQVTAVPVPAALWLFMSALSSLSVMNLRRKSRA